MAHKFTFTVEVEVERVSGKFASRDDMENELITWLNDANESTLSGIGPDYESEYEVTDWEVT